MRRSKRGEPNPRTTRFWFKIEPFGKLQTSAKSGRLETSAFLIPRLHTQILLAAVSFIAKVMGLGKQPRQ